MKHWIGVLCVGAAFALVGFAVAPQDAGAATFGSATDTAAGVSDGLVGLGMVVGLIGLVGLAVNLLRAERN